MDRIVNKKCQQCGDRMSTVIDCDDEALFKQLCAMWKPMMCERCTEYESKSKKIEKLKGEVWGEINMIEGRRQRLANAIEQGVIEPDSKEWFMKWDAQMVQLRQQVKALDLKERAVLGEYGRYLKQKTEEKGEKYE